MMVLSGGRAAEEVIFGNYEITTGASSDIERLNQIANELVAYYGMENEIGLKQSRLNNISDLTDNKITLLINATYELTKELIIEYKSLLEILKKEVMIKHTIDITDLKLKFKSVDNLEKRLKKHLIKSS
jgi:ATP-dependent Zn protease